MGTSPITIGVGKVARALVIPPAPGRGRPPPPQGQPSPRARQAELVICEQPIENGLHWVLDVVFGEDACRLTERRAARNLALLRKIALNLVAKDRDSQASLRGRRKKAAWNDDYMLQLIVGHAHA
jgi:hypothetical protein